MHWKKYKMGAGQYLHGCLYWGLRTKLYFSLCMYICCKESRVDSLGFAFKSVTVWSIESNFCFTISSLSAGSISFPFKSSICLLRFWASSTSVESALLLAILFWRIAYLLIEVTNLQTYKKQYIEFESSVNL